MHFLVYVRRSLRTSGDADVSDEAQVAAAVAMLPVGATHEVIADSGGHHSGRTDDRDGLRELVRRVDERSCDGIAVYDLSRLARNARLTLNLHAALEAAGIPLLIANMPHTRWDTATGRFMLGQLALAAQFQADQDSERARAIRRALYEDGRHRGLPPFGYRNGRDETGRRTLLVDEPAAAIVRRVFDELARRSFSEVADRLAAEGLPAPGPTGWTRYAVRDVYLRAKLYLGSVVRGRGLEDRAGRHEPIITPELHRAAALGVAARARGGRRARPGRTYVLAGVLRCDCGRRMTGQVRGSRRYYVCRYCRRPSIGAEALELAVVDRIRGYRLAASTIDRMREELRARLAVPRDDATARARRRLEARLEALRKQHGWGDIDDATYRRERRETEDMLAALPDESKLVTFDRMRTTVVSMAAELEDMAPEDVKRTVALFCERAAPDGTVKWTPAVRPFFALAASGSGVSVSPQGSDLAVTPDDLLEWYAS